MRQPRGMPPVGQNGDDGSVPLLLQRLNFHLAHDAQGCNARVFHAAVVEKNLVANTEVIAQQIARLGSRTRLEGRRKQIRT